MILILNTIMENKEYHNTYNLKYYYKKKEELKQKLGNKCAICGSTKNLQFDHINPMKKTIDISKSITSTNKILSELSNIQLLCKSCHDSKTKRDNSNLKYCGEANGNHKLTSEEVFEIRYKYYNLETSYGKLSKEYGVSKTTIIDIIKYRIRIDN